MSVRMCPAAKDLPVFAQVAVRLLDALDERLPARSRPSNTGSLRKIPFSAERALRIYSPEPVAARPDVEVYPWHLILTYRSAKSPTAEARS